MGLSNIAGHTSVDQFEADQIEMKTFLIYCEKTGLDDTFDPLPLSSFL